MDIDHSGLTFLLILFTMNNPQTTFDAGFRRITLTALASYFKSVPVHRSQFVVSLHTFLSCLASFFESELLYYCFLQHDLYSNSIHNLCQSLHYTLRNLLSIS